MAISYDEWMAKKDLVHMSMHWAGQKPKQHMLEEKQSDIPNDQSKPENKSVNANQCDRSSLSERFRSYQI